MRNTGVETSNVMSNRIIVLTEITITLSENRTTTTTTTARMTYNNKAIMVKGRSITVMTSKEITIVQVLLKKTTVITKDRDIKQEEKSVKSTSYVKTTMSVK